MTVVLSFTCFKQTLFSAAQVIAGMNLRSEEVVLGQGTLRPDLIESASGLASNKVSSSRYSKMMSFEIFYRWLRPFMNAVSIHLLAEISGPKPKFRPGILAWKKRAKSFGLKFQA